MKWAIAYHMQSGFLEKWTISFWHFLVLKWGQTYKQGMHELICLKMVTQCFVVDRGHDLGRCDRHRGTFETEHYWWSFSGWRLCQIHDLNSSKCICVFHSCKETHTHTWKMNMALMFFPPVYGVSHTVGVWHVQMSKPLCPGRFRKPSLQLPRVMLQL